MTSEVLVCWLCMHENYPPKCATGWVCTCVGHDVPCVHVESHMVGMSVQMAKRYYAMLGHIPKGLVLHKEDLLITKEKNQKNIELTKGNTQRRKSRAYQQGFSSYYPSPRYEERTPPDSSSTGSSNHPTIWGLRNTTKKTQETKPSAPKLQTTHTIGKRTQRKRKKGLRSSLVGGDQMIVLSGTGPRSFPDRTGVTSRETGLPANFRSRRFADVC